MRSRVTIRVRPPSDRTAHIGIHAQKGYALHWIGVVVPVGYMTAAQIRGLAGIASEMGDGDIRLTVWQNLLISGVPAKKLKAAQAKIEELALAIEANAIRSGLVACTGNTRPKVRSVRHQTSCRGYCALVRDAGLA